MSDGFSNRDISMEDFVRSIEIRAALEERGDIAMLEERAIEILGLGPAKRSEELASDEDKQAMTALMMGVFFGIVFAENDRRESGREAEADTLHRPEEDAGKTPDNLLLEEAMKVLEILNPNRGRMH